MSARRLKILFLVSGFPTEDQPSRGIFNLRAAQGLREFVDLDIIYLRAWKPGRAWLAESVYDGFRLTTVAVPQLPSGGHVNPIIYKALGWRLLSSRIRNSDLLHTVDAWNGIATGAWARRARRHHVVQVIGSDLNYFLTRYHDRWGIRGWHHHANGVACNSRALAEAFSRLYPQARNVSTVYRGVDLESFSPVGKTDGPLALCSPVRFLFLGGFPRHQGLRRPMHAKGGQTLLSAWQMAEKRFDGAAPSLLLAGPDSDGELLGQWRAGLKFPERVYIHQGPILPNEVPSYLRAADVVLVPSLREGLPNVGMEAAACGRAVFGSDAGGIPEIVAQNRTGLILPTGDVTAWANALSNYTRQPGPLRQMGLCGRNRMEEDFDRRLFAPKMVGLYEAARREPLCPSLSSK